MLGASRDRSPGTCPIVFPEAPGLLSRKGSDTNLNLDSPQKAAPPEISKGLGEEGPVQLFLKADTQQQGRPWGLPSGWWKETSS